MVEAMRYDVRMRRIDSEGRWEEWVSGVDADDRVAALVKVLRRRGCAEWLLEPDRFRFSVTLAE